MVFKDTSTSIKSSRAQGRRLGFTLVELMVSTGVTAILSAVIIATIVYCGKTFCGMGNYTNMAIDAREAIDIMARDIREASVVTELTSSSVKVKDASGNDLQYTYDSSSQKLTRVYGSSSKVMLKGCSSFSFAGYSRVPQPGNWTPAPATKTSSVKMIQVNWTCFRKVVGTLINTESVQTARIVIRNNQSFD